MSSWCTYHQTDHTEGGQVCKGLLPRLEGIKPAKEFPKDNIVQLIGKYQQQVHGLRAQKGPVAATSRLVLEEVISDLKAVIELEDHQHVVYMAGTNRWEIKGTGAVWDGPRRQTTKR